MQSRDIYLATFLHLAIYLDLFTVAGSEDDRQTDGQRENSEIQLLWQIGTGLKFWQLGANSDRKFHTGPACKFVVTILLKVDRPRLCSKSTS